MKISTGNRIDSVLAAVKEASSTQGVAAIMRDLRRGEDDTVVIGPYRLSFESLDFLEREHEGLKRVQHLNLSSAPQIVDFIRTGNGHGVLVTKLEGVSNAELQLASPGMGSPITTKEVRKALRAEVEKLRGAGLWNEMLERGGAWLLNPETKRVIISSWAQVAPADQNTLQAGCEQVLRMIDHA